MYNPINPNKPIHPPTQALVLLAARVMQVIDHNKSIMAIAAYERSLGPKVERLLAVRSELTDLAAATKKLSILSDAEIDGLDAVTRVWGAHLVIGTSLELEDIGILEARTPEGKLDNSRNLMEMRREVWKTLRTVQSLEYEEGVSVSPGIVESFHSVALNWWRGGNLRGLLNHIELAEGDLLVVLNQTIDLLQQLQGAVGQVLDSRALWHSRDPRGASRRASPARRVPG